MSLTRLNSRLITTLRPCQVLCAHYRNFCSEKFELKVEWNERLKAPIFGKLEMEKYFLDIDRQHVLTGVTSHIDLDIFSNGLLISKDHGVLSKQQDIEARFEQVEELLRRFRASPEAIKLLDSTTHAVTRNALDGKETDILMKILNNRIKYGLIHDDFTNTFLMNQYLKSENYRDASKVAINMMLQEEFNVPIASEMSLYAVFNYMKQLRLEGEEALPWDPKADPVEPEPEDEVQIRVEELENPYFDDHFDIVDRSHLLGKTLALMAKHRQGGGGEFSTINNSLQLLGYTFYEKWDKVNQITSEKEKFCQDCIEEAIHHAGKLGNSEIENRLKNVETTDMTLLKSLKSLIDESVKTHEETYVKNQVEVYKRWNQEREEALDGQKKYFEQQAKFSEIEQSKIQLDEKEKKLFFFDNYYGMEREKRQRVLEWTKTFPKKTGSLFGTPIRMGKKDPRNPPISRREKLAAKRK